MVIQRLDTPHEAVRARVMQMLAHVNARVRGRPTRLPLGPLATLHANATHAVVKNFALASGGGAGWARLVACPLPFPTPTTPIPALLTHPPRCTRTWRSLGQPQASAQPRCPTCCVAQAPARRSRDLGERGTAVSGQQRCGSKIVG